MLLKQRYSIKITQSNNIKLIAGKHFFIESFTLICMMTEPINVAIRTKEHNSVKAGYQILMISPILAEILIAPTK